MRGITVLQPLARFVRDDRNEHHRRVGITGIASGIAEMAIGSAAVGATAENKDVFGLVLLLTVIPETIVIFGLVVALLLIF